MSWMGGWFDPELEDLFHNEPELLETAQQVRAARPRVEADPRFQNRLRAQLVAEASRGGNARGVRRWWRLGPAHFAWGGAFVGAALITATVLTFVSSHTTDQTITAFSQLTAQHSVSPNQVITVSFNQAMDETAVESGVHIQPAIKVTYSWNDNDLVISPAYHLSANTPYTVTIAQAAIRSASGTLAAAPINITFGTAPTPTPAPVAPPALNANALGLNGTGGSLLFAPDGSVVSTVGVLPASAIATPSASASLAPATSPATQTPTPEGVITQSPDIPGALVEYPASGTPAQIGPSPSAAAYSPNGRYLATAVSDGNGGSLIVASQSNGLQPNTLIDSAAPVTGLTWTSNDRVVYTDGTTISSVDLSHATAVLYTLPSGSGTITTLAPGGAYAYVSPATGTGGSLLNVSSGTEQVLQGAVTDLAFSGNGSTVAWIDESSHPARLLTETVGQAAPSMIPMSAPGATPSDVTLDQIGDEAGYISTDTSGVAEVVVAQLPSGTPLAVGSPSDPSQLTLSPRGDQIAFISSTSAGAAIEEAAVPGAKSKASGPTIPAGANATLQAFVQAQVGQDGQPDLTALATLGAADLDVASSTPENLSRAYIISTYLVALPQGGVGASIELIVDPTAGHTTARVASEKLLLMPGPGGYVVTQATTSPLRDESAGPHVVQVSSTAALGVTTLQVSFDSDLNPSTVAGAISVLSVSGETLDSTAVYDPDTRTAVVTISNAPAGTLTLDISTALADFEGESLARSFTTQVEANS
jgi:hypothetical protein